METIASTNTAHSRKKSLKKHWEEFKRQQTLQLMVLPWIIFIVIFSYVPMYGLLMAFQDYRLADIPGFSAWVGLKHFNMLFQNTEFIHVIENTLGISLLKLLICFPAPIILALLLNEVKSMAFKRTVQTVSYLPHFVSWVVVAGLTLDILNPSGGILNQILLQLHIISKPILFIGEPKYFWNIVISTDLWKEIGWNAIIYIAAIASIDPELYQAAEVDGAGRFSKMWHITLPSIRPTIIILLILAISNLLNAGFEQILLLTNNMTNTMVRSTADVIDTYVYRVGIQQMRYSYATAAGLFRSVVSIVLLTLANLTARKTTEESLW